MNIIETKHAYALINEGVGECSLSAKKVSGDNNALVIEELALYSSDDFGKGYGKEVFLKVLDQINESLIIVPVGVFIEKEESLFVGRKKISSYDQIFPAIENLKQFYISCLKEAKREYKILKTDGDLEFIYISSFSF